MDCIRCNNKNRLNSKFCRFCGEKFVDEKVSPGGNLVEFPFQPTIAAFKRKLSPKAITIVLVILALSGTSVYAASKVRDFIEVRTAIKSAQNKSAFGDYRGALDILTAVENKWSPESQKQELNNLKLAEEKYSKYQETVINSAEKEKAGSLVEARDLLQSIGSDYPKYEEVRTQLSNVQAKIEGGLEAEAKAASSARIEAENKAQAESIAKARAEVDAQAARDAKDRSDAEATAAVQQARDAELQRQQAEIQRQEEVKKSFGSQLTNGYNSYSQGATYYSSAIGYSNSGDSILALSTAASARAVLNTARNTVFDLNLRFTGLPSDYYDAASNMVSAIDNLSKALDLVVQTEGTSLDYSSSINSYKNIAVSYAARVKAFLDANSY